MRKFLKIAVILAGKARLTHFLFPIGTKVAKFILPEEGVIEVGKYKMLVEPKKDLGLYFGYENVEPGVISFLRKLLKKDDVFFDIGAYKGYYSLMVAELVGENGKVIAFEPGQKAFQALVKDIEPNDLKDRILAMNLALSDFNGENYFLEAGEGSGISSSGNQIVQVATLDNVVNQLNIGPSVIKIDVEGSEFSVLKGSLNTLKKYHPQLIIEIHTNADFKLFDFLTSLGYHFYLVDNNGELLSLSFEEIKERILERTWTKYGTKINQHIYFESEKK